MPLRKRFFKTTALQQLRKAFSLSLSDEEKETASHHHTISRRNFLSSTSKATAALALAALYERCTPSASAQPSIIIVGAGIAGLHAAYILKQAGYNAYIYEGSARVGGRIHTAQDIMGEGLWTEMGGEFIDTTHEDMLNLAKHFNLPLLDRREQSELSLEEFSYYFNGQHYHLKDVLAELKPYAAQIKKDIESLSDEITYSKHSADDVRLDNMSIMQYIDSLGITGWFRSFIYNSYTAEYGMDANEQSAISFLGVFDPGDDTEYKLYGDSDERYSVIGGNHLIIEALENELSDYILTNHFLTSIKQNADKTYTLNFKITASGEINATADIVLLTIPFTVLRDVNMQVPIPEVKMNTIKNLGYGTNSKLFVGVNERVWRQQGYAGYAFSDNGMMNGYDHTQMQHGNTGIGGYTIFLGGQAGVDVTGDVVPIRNRYVQALDAVFPGVAKAFNNNFQMWNWPGYGYSKGSYVSYKVGQYTTMSGCESEPVENIYFAGEHCSYEFQGFMNGGAETGRKAAGMIIEKLKKS